MTDVLFRIFQVLQLLLQLLSFIIIAWAVLSWLVAFDVVNLRNRFVYGVSRLLDNIVRPVLYPLHRMIPNLGGMDITPIIALLLIQAMRQFLLPNAFAALATALGG